MKQITLCAINAKYTHSSLSVRCLKHAADPAAVSLVEAGINDALAGIVNQIVQTSPGAVGFSCYIWNIELVLKAASTVKKILPGCFILLGGPEVSPRGEALLRQHSFIDMVVRGPGEVPFAHFAQRFCRSEDVSHTPSAYLRSGGEIITTPDAPPFSLADLPVLYNDLSQMKNRIVYYETSRGCPYRCDFCVSAGSEVTFLPTDRVKQDFERFLRADVMQVKLVDRTFNYPPDRAHDIFSALITLKSRYPHASTNFHFELSANLLKSETIELLKTAPPGLIQVEIGVQSTHAPALAAVHRIHNTQKLLRAAEALCRMPNIHVHTDLIAGLPLEDYLSFTQSFNDVYSLGDEQLQLGFLKVLPGTAMRETVGQYGIVYTDYPPYEVLRTDRLSYSELRRLHRIADTLDALHNSGHFAETLRVLTLGSASAFQLFEALADHLLAVGYFDAPRRIADLFSMLLKFAQRSGDPLRAADALRYDWLCLQKPGRWPAGLAQEISGAQRQAIRSFFQDGHMIEKYLPEYAGQPAGQIARKCQIERFVHLWDHPQFVLFNYGKNRHEIGFSQIVRELL